MSNYKDNDFIFDDDMIPKKYSSPFSNDTDTTEIDIDIGNGKVYATGKIPNNNRILRDIIKNLKEMYGISLDTVGHLADEKKKTERIVPNVPSENALIKNMSLSDNNFDGYSEEKRFYNSAKALFDAPAEEAPFFECFAYHVDYAMMSRRQLKGYLWWRHCFRNGKCIKCCEYYIKIFLNEILVLPDLVPAETAIDYFVRLWRNYKELILLWNERFASWFLEYCIIYSCKLPEDVYNEILFDNSRKKTATEIKRFTLYEYMLTLSSDLNESYLLAMLYLGGNYKWFFSTQIPPDKTEYYHREMRRAFLYFADKLRDKFELLQCKGYSDAHLKLSHINGKPFVRSLCAGRNAPFIYSHYYALSISEDEADLVTEIVKECENNIRLMLGIRSKLRLNPVYQIFVEPVADEYFKDKLPANTKKNSKSKKDAEPDYMAQYDAVSTGLSTDDAKKIEQDSWQITQELVDSFEEPEATNTDAAVKSPAGELKTPDTVDGAKEKDDNIYIICAKYILDGDLSAFAKVAKTKKLLVQTLVDNVNEALYDAIGDICIEPCEGAYRIVPDYIEDVKKLIVENPID